MMKKIEKRCNLFTLLLRSIVATLCVTTTAALLLTVFNTINTDSEHLSTFRSLSGKVDSLRKQVRNLTSEEIRTRNDSSAFIEALQSKLQSIHEKVEELQNTLTEEKALAELQMSNFTADAEEANITLVGGPVNNNCITTPRPLSCTVSRLGLHGLNSTSKNNASECITGLKVSGNDTHALRDVKCYIEYEYESQLVNPAVAALIYNKDTDTWQCLCSGVYINTTSEFQNFDCLIAATVCPKAPVNFVEVLDLGLRA